MSSQLETKQTEPEKVKAQLDPLNALLFEH